MTHAKRYDTRQQKARQRRLQKERERLEHEQARAPRALAAVEQAIQELGLPETVAAEVQWRLRVAALLSAACRHKRTSSSWPKRGKRMPHFRLGQAAKIRPGRFLSQPRTRHSSR